LNAAAIPSFWPRTAITPSMWNKQREAAAAREKLKEIETDPDVAPNVARVT